MGGRPVLPRVGSRVYVASTLEVPSLAGTGTVVRSATALATVALDDGYGDVHITPLDSWRYLR